MRNICRWTLILAFIMTVIISQSSALILTEDAKLTASDAAAYDWFGMSVAVSGETFVVGTYLDDDAGPDSGSAYVYDGLNKPPVAEAGGPYNVDEGNSITLDGTGSIDPDGDPITYEWDLDNDGIYEIQAGTTEDLLILLDHECVEME